MQLVEQTIITRNDLRYAAIDAASFASKNLYNAGLYEMRQAFIFRGIILTYPQMHQRMKHHEAYRALPAKVSQQVLRVLEKNWKAYIKAYEAHQEDPSKFLGHPKLPKYKDKQKGRNILIYTIQAISKTALRKGVIAFSGLPVSVPVKHTNIDQVRIVPRKGFYVIEVVYEQELAQVQADMSLIAGIDIGLNNLATLTSNKSGFVPRLVNGRPVKSINQWYNKERTRLQSELEDNRGTSEHLERLTNKRTRKINHYLHCASRRIIDLLAQEGIGTLVIGHNPEWKQQIGIGKRNNQNFVSVPHARFIEMLSYKAQLVGIVVKVTEESYTSKCSFLDNEPIEKHASYCGRRIKRGLFRSKDGTLINADVNGSLNIIKKVAPDAFAKGVEGAIVVHPLPLAIGA